MSRILVVSQYYYPEQFSITHICETLTLKGNEVTVLTGIPNYPMGEVFPGYENSESVQTINNVEVIRVPIKTRKSGLIKNYLSYALNASRRIKRIVREYDIVLVYEVSPITQAIPAYIYKNRHKNSKVIIYCQDIWPEVLLEAGIKRKSIVFCVAKIISGYLYRKADKILITSELFADYLYDEFSISKKQTKYIPNYGDDWVLKVDKKNDDKRIHILFAGNVGKAQNLDLLVDAVSICDSKSDLIVDIVGDGSAFEELKKKVSSLCLDDIIVFHGRKRKEELQEYYCMADAFFLSLKCRSRVCYTVPAKVQGYLGAGKPIIAVIKGGAATVLEEAGAAIFASDDKEELASVIDDYCKNSEKYEQLGEKARNYYLQNYTEEIYFDRLVSFLCKLD